MQSNPKMKAREYAVVDRNKIPVILFYDEDNDETIMGRAVATLGALKVVPYTYDPGTGDYIEEQPQELKWNRSKLFYDANDNAIYICKNTDIDAAEADTDWFCWKLNYDSNDNMDEKEGPRLGAVTVAPSGLSWNI